MLFNRIIKNKNVRTFILWLILLLCALVILIESSSAQSKNYPKVVGYFSVYNPFGSWNKDGFTSNFEDVYTVAFPFGINILKSNKFGVSFEIAPVIRTENNICKVSSVVFHPGAMFRFKHGFTFIGQLAFETNGRLGLTPVFNQVLIKGKDASFYVSVPLPFRFGNNMPTSLSTGLQLGVNF